MRVVPPGIMRSDVTQAVAIPEVVSGPLDAHPHHELELVKVWSESGHVKDTSGRRKSVLMGYQRFF